MSECKIKKLLVANRSEIAIRIFRSTHELGIRTVGIYTHEDRYALHRTKADEAYQIGKPGHPVKSYLDIESIIALAKQKNVDAIHPGYGFLSENAEFAQACEDAGIIFVGPRVETLQQLGDKISARKIADQVGVPVLGGSGEAITDAASGLKTAQSIGFPIILKAAHGGGGRGMRVVQNEDEFEGAFEQARSESLAAFGSPDVFVEKFITRARHIEVQLLGDKHGQLVHLYERDCSVQRRHQKVVEIAPAPNIDPDVRTALCEAALKIGQSVNYECAGTVEFLLDADTNQFYFIEVNPRIQVEHTVTEEVTGVDIVKSQILIAQGSKLSDPEISINSQEEIKTHGFAVQCRVTTEDPTNNFMPDYGRVAHYRSASGMGVRLDAGTAFSGAMVFPYYDSLLVKVTIWARTFKVASARVERCLQEFRIRGVKTNIPFLLKLITNPTFIKGDCFTRFIDETPDLFEFPKRHDRATKLLTYLADTIVNGNPLVKDRPKSVRRKPAPVPAFNKKQISPPDGMRQKLLELGAEKFGKWILDQKPLLLTDTSFRDAHQSLYATRFRTHDMLQIAEAYAYNCPQLFSLEMWGGATFDTSMRFLKESPWQRLAEMRRRVPNILFQMLIRASSAVGYTNYPDNVVRAFVKEAADAGIDVFRVFDALNWVPNMKIAMEEVQKSGAICEASICYTGDILDPAKTKYDLKYYVKMAKELENMGAHILAIKDMAGLCKPYAAQLLVKTLKEEIGIPIHFHTHDTGGGQAASILKAAEVGLDIADGAVPSMSGGTSQPNLNTILEAQRFTDHQPTVNVTHMDDISEYWRAVRNFYTAFESPVLPAGANLYEHEMPGGQYTNLLQQAQSLGLGDRWSEVCHVYAEVNQLLGDIVKVTPTSKAVGDMALFLVANDLSCDDVVNGDRDLSFPESVLDLVSGRMGQTPGGFPENVQKRILRGEAPLTERPGSILPPADFEDAAKTVQKMIHRKPTDQDVVSYLLYPKVFEDFSAHLDTYYDTSGLPTFAFFNGLEPEEEISVDIAPGKTLIIKFLAVGKPHTDGCRTVFFELNGQPREVVIVDKSLTPQDASRLKADSSNPKQIGSAMPGVIVSLSVKVGSKVKAGDQILMLEAMKMQTSVISEQDGVVSRVLAEPGTQVEAGDLLIELE
ncbi:MAG: pyruvate carboxylase [Planctomycetes bacterium]|nr:pyruvate carboxylase [Planctomycetota bacterium]MCH9723898.1 pyruvate carboxylase [Planctomycetota bacterium]MCH9778624.1 pyruvate carboxylase [Planctomycetota bacterium]MCH9789760.1 pyruvate carboxylase [Planctomycetota bacterium]